ncbi:hypothetical protein E7Z59_01485 [Robertkochia marina]|uniref:Phosphatase PAP2 family protein n=1 Tax=Robertkochia marina TaxID=1227945 RepID=A0A4S3M2E9_9FLAO|nr:hypothetical protein [Robertkochia marina]THD69030.1 hypothetical protein E7Z59_01485 [Robertkochia marina]TRZ44853.1 hypothetical protein D3A96_07450 [Robertkochia marina]
MQFFSKLISFVFNPLFMPFGGTLAYFLVTPRFSPPENIRAILAAVFIITVAIPILFFFLLRNVGWIRSSGMEEVAERRIPLAIYIVLTWVVSAKIIPSSYSTELYFFFVGVLGALLTCLFLVYFKYKASMHMMGISGLTTFLIGLSFHFEKNIVVALSLLVLSIGAVASARLYQRAHSTHEIVTGLFVGFVTQLITFGHWL